MNARHPFLRTSAIIFLFAGYDVPGGQDEDLETAFQQRFKAWRGLLRFELFHCAQQGTPQPAGVVGKNRIG